MLTARPVVSVIVSAENPGEALERTLDSVEGQSFPSVEVLLCGPHEHLVALGEIVSQRFVPLVVEIPREGGGAWKAGLVRASGEFVCCLLAGDELAPTYLEKCLFQIAVNGEDAGAAGEQPRDRAPHISVMRKSVLTLATGSDGLRKSVLTLATGSDGLGGLEEQRVKFASFLAGAMGAVPEILARPADPPIGNVATVPPLVPRPSGSRCFSYAGLVTGWPQPLPTVLLAMPFLTMGGSETIVSQLCRQLKRLGFRILVYTTVPTTEVQGDTTSWFEGCAAGIYHLPRFLDGEHWPAFLAYLIQQHGVSVLWQVGSSYTYELLPMLRELFPELAVVDLLFNTLGHTTDYLKYNYLIDHVVTEHEGMKAWLLERGTQEDQVSVIPNGVDLVAYSPRRGLDWRTRQPRLPGAGRFVAAFFGRLSEEKAPDVFLEIAALLADQPSIEFLLCGSGPLEQALRSEAAARGLTGRVNFLGFVSTRDYLPCCDAVVVCSRMDGRPNIVMESLAMGVPVVASRVGGIPEMMPPDEEDLLCEPANAAAFAAAIRLLACCPDRYQRFAQAARRHAEAHMSIADSGQAYARIFDDLRHKRQSLARHLTPETVAASLRYDLAPTSLAPRSTVLRLWRAYSPLSWPGHFRNALLLWKLRRSGREQELLDHFDADFYTGQFPANTRQTLFPLLHYVFLGFREGRNPSPTFDTRYYLRAHPDVRRSGVNPLLHYVIFGEREGRVATGKPNAPKRPANIDDDRGGV